MFSYAYDFTPELDIASIDEGYSALGGQEKLIPREVADKIRQSLKITVSEAIGANRLVSQIASKLRKPACFLEVPGGEERGFLAPDRGAQEAESTDRRAFLPLPPGERFGDCEVQLRINNGSLKI